MGGGSSLVARWGEALTSLQVLELRKLSDYV